MVLTVIALIVSLAGIAVFPCWPYSARWSYWPSAIAGLVLIVISVLSIGSKATTSEALAARLAGGVQVAQIPADAER